MNKDEFKEVIKKDKYLLDRKKPSDAEVRLYLKEVNFHCPLCGKPLQLKNQKKKGAKKFEIAHIYPNSPTFQQYIELIGLERLGENSESIENKIALCKDCHDDQDYHTTKEDYLKLLNKKKDLMKVLDIGEVLDIMQIQEDIKKVINKLNNLNDSTNLELKYDPVVIDKKIRNDFLLLKRKVKSNVSEFYPFIFDEFKKNEIMNNNNSYDVICSEVKTAYFSIKKLTDDQNIIFNRMVEWLKFKTQEITNDACEIVISFFIQNCEVFDEITK